VARASQQAESRAHQQFSHSRTMNGAASLDDLIDSQTLEAQMQKRKPRTDERLSVAPAAAAQ
jgi:hypothetical protein